jgi:anti-anti-sigma factor
VEITERRVDNVVVVAVSGRVGDATPEASEFHERVMQLADSAVGSGRSVVFDFAALDYINSMAERTLMMACRRARGTGTRLAVASLPPIIKETWAIAHFDLILPAYPSVDEAVAALAAGDRPA